VAAGMNDSRMEVAEKFTRFFYKPVMLAAMSVVLSPVLGLIFSLILSAFLKREPAPTVEGAPPIA